MACFLITKSDMFFSRILALAACLFVTESFAWNDTVHMIIAEIAKNHLNPKVLGKIEDLAENIDGEFPPPFDFIESACWMNDISRCGCKVLDSWHEMAMPYDPGKVLSDADRKAILSKLKDNSSVFALNEAMSTLKNPQAGPWEKNFMLRILLHCIAELHQPLACTSFYSVDFPSGDGGGKLFMIRGKQSLREFWDNGLDFVKNLGEVWGWTHDRTFEEEEEMSAALKKILSEFPPSSFVNREIGEFEDWAIESHELAATYAYQGIKPGEIPTSDYIQRCRPIAIRQIALAGYRLAGKLNEIFSR